MRNLAENNKSTVKLSLESIKPRVNALGYEPNEIVPDLNFLNFDLEQYSYGQSNNNKDKAILSGQQITPIDAIDPTIATASDVELLEGLF